MSRQAHRKAAPKKVAVGVLSVSSTRTLENDKSGHWINQQATKEGHDVVFHHVVPDDAAAIVQSLLDGIRHHDPRAVLLTGGTGISSKDVTIEAVCPLFRKELTAFGPLFTQLSFDEIDAAAILSRATAGMTGS